MRFQSFVLAATYIAALAAGPARAQSEAGTAVPDPDAVPAAKVEPTATDVRVNTEGAFRESSLPGDPASTPRAVAPASPSVAKPHAPASTAKNAPAAKSSKVVLAPKKSMKNSKSAASHAASATKTAAHRAVKGTKMAAAKVVKGAKSAGGKISKGTKNGLAQLKASAAKRHAATVARGKSNDAAHACAATVTEKSGNAVGNPCLTTRSFAHARGVKPKQVAKAHSQKAAKAAAKKRATH